MSALATVRAAPGLDAYLEELEDRLAVAVAARPGLVAEIGAEALASGGKRLRPLLVFLAADPEAESPVAAGVAIELVHMASLVHDDLIDGAQLRRGKASVWSAYGPDAARAGGVYLFARAFAELAATDDARAVAILADAALALVRGEGLERAQRRRPDTTVEEYLTRCALKTAKLFEAACLLVQPPSGARRVRARARASRSRSSTTASTARARPWRRGRSPARISAKASRRSRSCSLPRRTRSSATRSRAAHSTARCSESRASGAIEEAQQVARNYAEKALACLEGIEARDELEAIAEAVVDRTA